MVLKAYLQAWLPVMGLSNDGITLIDGFAGPGEYKNNEPGSPLIMLNTLLTHDYREKIPCQVDYLFWENKRQRYLHLNQLITSKYSNLPSNVSVNVYNDDFDSGVQAYIRGQTLHQPYFVMVDPFGVKDTPLSIIEEILKCPKSEVYLSLMYESINRFKKQPEFTEHLNKLFGCDKWQQGVDIEDKKERREFFNALYKQQLRKAGASQVLHFELYRGDRHVYTIFFATKHVRGSDKMKEAIWKAVPDGSYRFRGGMQQIPYDFTSVDYMPLHKALYKHFGQKPVDVQEALDFIASDNTDFPTSGIKKRYFKPYEKAGLLHVSKTSKRHGLSYPKGISLSFVSDRQQVDFFD